jgi:DNA-binding transcriptional MocR family regulator
MTWRQQPAIWRVEGLRPMERLVLLALSYFSNQSGSRSYPAQRTLAAMCSCSIPTVKRSLKSLRNRHLIIVEGKGRKGTIRYRIALPLTQKGGSLVNGGGDHQRSTIQLKNPINKRDSYFNSSSTGGQLPTDRTDHLDSFEAIQRIDARRRKTYGR